MDYIAEYGLTLINNASGDPEKEPEVKIEKGNVVLNKAATDTLGVKLHPQVEVRAGKQTGAVIYALTVVPKETHDSISFGVPKSGIVKIPFKKPLKNFRLDLNKDHQIDLVQCEQGILVFAILTEMPVKKPKEVGVYADDDYKTFEKTAPYGPLGAEFGLIGETVLDGSDF